MLHQEDTLAGFMGATQPWQHFRFFWRSLILPSFNNFHRFQPGRSELWMRRSEKALGCLQTCFVPAEPGQRPPQPHFPASRAGSPGAPPSRVSFPIAAIPRGKNPRGSPQTFPAPRSAQAHGGNGGRAAPRYVRGDYLAAEDLGGSHGEGGESAVERGGTPGASAGWAAPTAALLRAPRGPKLSGPPAPLRKRCPRPGGGRRGAPRDGCGLPPRGRCGGGGAVSPPLALPPPSGALYVPAAEGSRAERRGEMAAKTL